MRAEFSRKTRRLVLERAAGRCEKCAGVMKRPEIDHILPCAMGGEPTAENAMALCHTCHGEKSALDVRMIRKSDRMRDKATGAIRPAGTIPSRKPITPASAKRAARRQAMAEIARHVVSFNPALAKIGASS